MTGILIFIAVVIFICVFLNNASNRIGMPMLLAFILLGVLFGNNSVYPVRFADYKFTDEISTVALIFIMFYGGFGTRWSSAKKVAVEAGLLATLGVALTAGLTGLFCRFVLKWGWIESFLMGSVISSTDAASVFSILRSRKLGLKNGSAPLLEVESGSNDPMSYMLTTVMITLLNTSTSVGHVAWMLVAQLGFGAVSGILIAQLAAFIMKRFDFSSGFDSLFLIAVALFSYAIPDMVGGNGFLSAYLVGIILGNGYMPEKKKLVHFFDGFTSLMQVLIFFMLGLLARPAMLERCILPAIAIFGVMLLVSRPLAVASILVPFKRYPFRQRLFVSFAGLRGAASIVFAIMATAGNTMLQNDIFNIVFCIVLLSISIQGTLIPFVAGKLDMIDYKEDVMTTFSDFSEETDMQFSEILIAPGSNWAEKKVMDLGMPRNLLICLVQCPDGTSYAPDGHSVLHEGDRIVMCTKAYKGNHKFNLVQVHINEDNKWVGWRIRDYPKTRRQIVLIRRNGQNIIPHGDTVIQADDTIYINRM